MPGKDEAESESHIAMVIVAFRGRNCSFGKFLEVAMS
jgi:hypothetical protein